MPPRSKFTLFPIYSEDQILSNYSQSGSPEKVNGLQILKYPFLIKKIRKLHILLVLRKQKTRLKL